MPLKGWFSLPESCGAALLPAGKSCGDGAWVSSGLLLSLRVGGFAAPGVERARSSVVLTRSCQRPSSARGQDGSAVRAEMLPVLAGAARAKANVVAEAWSAQLDAPVGAVGMHKVVAALPDELGAHGGLQP